MKRPIFIIIGAILVIILIAIWVYVLFYGSPKNNDSGVFSDLNFNDTTDPAVIINDIEDKSPTIEISSPERLRQLTTKPIIGHQEVRQTASSTPEIQYIESGTGHVFSINTVSGEEKRLSGTTIKDSRVGAITPNGSYVMVQSGLGSASTLSVWEVGSSSEAMIIKEVAENIVNLQATVDNTFLYAVRTNHSVVGKHYYPISDTSETIFTIPFREAMVDWGDSATDTHYTYPKASSKLEGYLYQIKNGQIKRMPIDGYGLSAEGNDFSVLYSKQMEGSYQTFLYYQEDDVSVNSPLTIIPEKCVHLNTNSSSIVCAETLTNYDNNMPDSWYQGTISYSDDIWEIDSTDIEYLNAKLLVDTKLESGRELDLINLVVNKDDSTIYFINKNDQTLWLYELDSSEKDSSLKNEAIDEPVI